MFLSNLESFGNFYHKTNLYKSFQFLFGINLYILCLEWWNLFKPQTVILILKVSRFLYYP